jgi:hypothetical protein
MVVFFFFVLVGTPTGLASALSWPAVVRLGAFA